MAATQPLRRLGALVLSLTTLAACGGTAANSSAAGGSSSSSLATPDSLDKLYQAAQKEGQVIWEAGPLDQGAEQLGQAFAKHYPGIKVTFSPVSDPQLPARVITEATAGERKVVSIDVGHGGASLFQPLLDRDLLLATDWTKFGLDSHASELDGRWLLNDDGVTIWLYNTTLVKPEDVPQQWTDLLKPRWKGHKIVTNAGPDALAQLFFVMGEDAAKQYLAKLKDQDLVVTKSKGPAREMVAGGQADIGVATIAELMRYKQTGAPVEAAPLGPMLHDQRGWYIPKPAQHPNAARLFSAWMVSAEGRAEQAKVGLPRSTPCDASDVAKYLCDRGIKYVDENTVGMDPIAFARKVNEYQNLAGQILGANPS